MHQQIGIAPDGRGKVGIGRIRQTEVALVSGGVNRLRQRAQHHGLDHTGIRTIANLLQQPLVIFRGRLLATR